MTDCKYWVDSGNPRKPICTAGNARIGTNPHIGVCLQCNKNPGETRGGIRAVSPPERCIHQYINDNVGCSSCHKFYCRLYPDENGKFVKECDLLECKDFVLDKK